MMQQAETLREVFPDFDLRQELQNQTFAQALGCGMTPEGAYLAAMPLKSCPPPWPMERSMPGSSWPPP